MNPEKTSISCAGVRRGTGVLLKLNLAPLMGRRDAAYDAVAGFAAGPCVFSRVGELLELLAIAERDSVELLSLLSSPDTIERERNMLAHIRKIIRLLQVLEAWSGSLSRKSVAADVMGPGDPDDPVMPVVIGRISSLIRNSASHLKRYRDYAAKSASVSHAERYNKSYSFYLEIYQSRLPALSPTVEVKL